MWLVDSTVYIDWMRAGRNPVRMLSPYVNAALIAACGIVRLEVLRGVIRTDVRQEMQALFDALPDLPLSPLVCHRAADLGWREDRTGNVLPATDLLIAACAIEHGAQLVSTDAHFATLADVHVVRELPLLPIPEA